MKIELFYFLGCPHHAPALDRLRQALIDEQLHVGIAEVEVHDDAMARAIGFLGSPTIRIDCLDIEPAARTSRDFGMCCRTYHGPGAHNGAPSIELIRRALREAVNNRTP